MKLTLPFCCRLFLLCFYLFHALPATTVGQNIAERDKSVAAPPSGKGLGTAIVGGIPINLFTGAASPSVPLYQLPSRSLSIPLALYYTAGNGVQVTSVASEVGTGWALAAGGSVQCEVKGRPDELDTDAKSWVAGIIDRTSGTYPAPMLCQGKDSEYDVYHLSAPGMQADFVIAGPNDVRVLNEPTLSIGIIYSTGTKRIYSITATDATGTRYTFSHSDITRVQTETKQLRTGRFSSKEDYRYTSSWQLTKMEDARGDVVNFGYQYSVGTPVVYKGFSHIALAYQECNYQEQNCKEATTTEASHMNNRYETTTTTQSISKANLSYISTSVCTARFYRERFSRRDAPGEKALDRIVIYDWDEKVMNSFSFNYSHFGPSNTTNSDDVRLRLDRISAKSSGCLSTSTAFLYREYGSTVSRRATNRDYWGYFNDNASNELLPFIESRFPSGDRTPSAGLTAQNCILYKIQQGTGAYTELTYGPQIDVTGTRVGGVRLEQVRIYDVNQPIPAQTVSVNYNSFNPVTGNLSTTSSAPAVKVPRFHDWQKVRWSTAYPGGWGGYGRALDICRLEDDLIDKFLYRSSEPIEPVPVDFIHYQWVTIQHANGSRSAYKFSTASDYADYYYVGSVKVTADPYNKDTGCYTETGGLPKERGGLLTWCDGDPMSPRLAGNYLNLPEDQRPYGILSSSANKRGHVLQQVEVDSQGRLISETTNTYGFYNYDNSALKSVVVARERYAFGYDMYNYYYNVKVYKQERDWIPITQQVITRYDQRRGNAGAIATQTQYISYEYRNKFLSKVKTSKAGDKSTYVVEYTRVSDGNAPTELINAKSYATVLKKEAYRLDVNSNKKGSFSTYYEFQPNGGNYVWPLRIGTVEAASGITQRQYQEKAVEMDSYGNAVNTLTSAGLWTGNLLAHRGMLPIASVANGKFSSGALAATAGHTSFEDDDNPDSWTTNVEYSDEAKTGKRSIRLSPQRQYGPERLFVLSPAQQKGKYKFTCWAKLPAGANAANLTVIIGLKNANGDWLISTATNRPAWYGVGYTVTDRQKWNLYTTTVNFDDPAVRAAIPAGQDVRLLCSTWMPSGNQPVLVDELRFHHENARMKTATYHPMVGKTSETDENNVTTYYLYDAENQPWLVKDADGNILKRTKTNSIATSREIEAAVARTGGNAFPGSAVVFTATAEACDSKINYSWNFGDGSTTKGSNVQSHTYAQTGTYSLTVVADAPDMNPVEKTLAVVVSNALNINISRDGSAYMDLCNPRGDGNSGQRNVSVTVNPQNGCSGYTYRWEIKEYNRPNGTWGEWNDAGNNSPIFRYDHYQVRRIQVRCTVTDVCGNTIEYEDYFDTYASSTNNCETVIDLLESSNK
ncbi:PKD domain-containing protein [Hymenobacter actinosclerus]|uniref:PKD domain-containing protein n=1 Tax=Hymenobacter actinosclerus TaxID=82805 RepID=A0A1I0IJ95_9BACT|nr:PKD domain-containing protein [Hymenobacter actinosclerus]SET97028.1 PKD domain-containing protein [Hymenobacter actinosclerus]